MRPINMLRRHRTFGSLLSLFALMAVAWPAMANDDEREHHRQDQLREAVERGDIKPFTDVLRIVQPQLPGEVVGVEVEYKTGSWIYEFRVLDAHGHMFEARVNAATAAITEIEEK
jgi:uncharacterized membrane protein YkoI